MASARSPTLDASPQSDEHFVTPIFGDEDAQSLILCNQKLQELGINDTIKLPRIVVLGDQSTGKSSLIEAISTIQVPKAANLCTRCPIAINLSSAQPPIAWECSVYIEERYSYNAAVKNKKVSKAHPLGPWESRNLLETTLIGKTQDQKDLLGLIYEAQDQVLNPSRTTKSLRNSTTSAAQEKFSPNVIRIDISVGNCPNLSFVDLPGVIQSAGRDEPSYYVDLVESLAKTYAQDDNNIIMVCLPMNHDVSNSKSYSIIQNESAQPHTMGVFTKADIARKEEQEDCLNKYFLSENEEEFQFGHHIVMLNASESTSDAEADFFSQTPWQNLPTNIRVRLGVDNLVSFLRDVLVSKTAKNLPDNLKKIAARVAKVQKELDSLPKPPRTFELPYKLIEHMGNFTTNVKQLFLSGQRENRNTSRSKLIKAMTQFDDRIQRDTPTMIKMTKREDEELRDAKDTINSWSAGAASQPLPVANETDDQSDTTVPARSKPKSTKRGHVFYLEDVRRLNKEFYQSSIGDDIELKAVEEMHRQSVDSWDTTFDEFMKQIRKTVITEVIQCVQNTFADLEHLPVYLRVQKIVDEYLESIIQEEWDRLQYLCAAERDHPLTFDNLNLKKAEAEHLEIRRKARLTARLEVKKTATHAETRKKPKEPTAADIGTDPWDIEVQMVSKNRAYYDVASHRFVDTVCQSIFAHLVPRCHGELADSVKTQLGMDDITKNQASLIALMTENSEREDLRRRLTTERDRLNAGRKYIRDALSTFGIRPSPFERDPSITSVGLMDNVSASDNEGTEIKPLGRTPGKRKYRDTSLGGRDDDEFDESTGSPFKRSQRRPGDDGDVGSSTRHGKMPDRSRSVELD